MFSLPRLVRSRHTRTTKGSDSYGEKDQRRACDGAAWHGNVGKGDIEDEGHRERQRQEGQGGRGGRGSRLGRREGDERARGLRPPLSRAGQGEGRRGRGRLRARVHCELQRVGVNQRLLWREYVDESGASGKARLSYGSFCRGYAAWVSARNFTNHLEHKPGQAVEGTLDMRENTWLNMPPIP